MRLAVIIIHYGSKSTTRTCLNNLKKKLGSHALILINNTSSDVTDLAKLIPSAQIIDNHQNLGFAHAVNQGISLASHDATIGAYLLLNNDLQLSFGNLDILSRTFLDRPSAGIVAPVLHHGGMFDWGGKFNQWWGTVKHKNFAQPPKTILTVEHVAGAAMLIKQEVVAKIGLFDPRFFLYYEDLDYCLRARLAGYTIHINPQVVAEHVGSSGSSLVVRTLSQWRSHFLFFVKHWPVTVFPSAILTDIIFYPLALLSALFRSSK